MIGPAARLVRDGPLASMASVGGVQRARTVPMWPLMVGVGLLAVRRRGVEGLRARVAAAERGHQRLDVGVVRGGVGDGVDRPAWCRPLVALLTLARPDRRASAGGRHSPLHTAVRILRGVSRREHQPHHRLVHHATARHGADRRAEGRPLAERLVDLLPIGARSEGRPDFRRHVRVVTDAADGRSSRPAGGRPFRWGRRRGSLSASHRAMVQPRIVRADNFPDGFWKGLQDGRLA